MDEIDRRIVVCLGRDARASFRAVGAQVGLSAPAVKRRVDRLEREGVLRGYTAVVDPAVTGWPMRAIVSLSCDGRLTGSQIAAVAGAQPEVLAAYTVAGEASAVLHVAAADTAHLEAVLERLREADGVLRTSTQIVFSTLFERSPPAP